MCVMSMVMDHYHDKWIKPPYWPAPIPLNPNFEPRISDAEIREFRELLERARRYDQKHNQPDCELEEKRAALVEIAKKLGVPVLLPE